MSAFSLVGIAQTASALPPKPPGYFDVDPTTSVSLYLVDTDAPGLPHRFRLLRIDPTTHRAELLGTWLKTPLTDRYFLSTLSSGELLIVASSSLLNVHVTGVLVAGAAQDTVRIRNVRLAAGSVAVAPRTSNWGVTLATFDKKNGVRPSSAPNDSFDPVKKTTNGKDKTEKDCNEVFP